MFLIATRRETQMRPTHECPAPRRAQPTRSPRGLAGLAILLALALAAGPASAQAPTPTFTKIFDPGSAGAGAGREAIGPGTTTTLRFDIDNSGSPDPVTGIAFTDVLPTEIVLADPPSAFTDCIDGVISFPAPAGTTISLSDARLGAGDACLVTVNVTSSIPGMHANTSGALTSSAGTTPGATASLFVDATLLGFSKSFAPGSIPLGGTSVLTFTFDNTAAGAVDQFSARFLDDLPAGMVIATPANASTDCIAPLAPNTTLTAVSGTSFIQFFAIGTSFPPGFCPPFCNAPVLMPGETCTVSVDVTTDTTGVFVNTARLPIDGTAFQGFATDALDVPLEFLTKSFIDDPVAPDGFVTLDFTVTNLDRLDSATAISFDDPLPAGLTFDSLVSDDCGGVLDTAMASVLKYSGGGPLLPEAACTLSVRLKVPAAAATGTATNTTTAIMATIGGIGVTGNTATDVLRISTAPVLTKEFLDAMTMAADPVVKSGDDVIVRFTITNPSTTSSATDIAFEDFFDSVLATASVTPGDDCCGAGSTCTFTPLIDIPLFSFVPANIAISGGSLAPAGMAGDSCTFSLTLDVGIDAEAGIYPNTTSDVTATVDGATQAGDPASDSFTVVSAPGLSKAFPDGPVVPGGTVTLEFTLTHPLEAPGDATLITFTDDLADLPTDPPGLVLSGLTANLPPTPDPPCGAGSTLMGSAGDTLLTFAGGTLVPGGSCTFSVTLDVPATAAAGTFKNTTSGVGAMVGGLDTTSAPAAADLGVFGLTFTKQFIGDPVMAGGTVTLQFTVDNTSLTDDATSISIDDNLEAVLPGLAPSGMLPATPCGPSSTLTFTGTTLSLAGGEVAAGDMCMYSVTLLVPGGTLDGNYPNATTVNLAIIGTTFVFLPPATDELTVNSTLLALSKAFTDDPVTPGGTATLEFTLTNLDAGNAGSMIDFTDDFGTALPGVTFDSVVNGCGAMVTGLGTGTLTVDDAVLGAGGTCTITASLTVPVGAAPGFYTNTTGPITGMIGGAAASGTAAGADLEVVQLLLFSKSFDGATTAGGTPKLTFTITNPGPGTAIGIGFTDQLDDVITGLIETNLPLFDICGLGSSLTSTSGSLLTLSGGQLPPLGGTCSIEVDLLVPVTATVGTFPNTTSDLFQTGLPVANPATDGLTVGPTPDTLEIPALNVAGLMLLALLLAGVAVARLRR